jgi:hypothetical protein
MRSFYRILCGLNEACFTDEGVFNVHDIHLWAADNSSVFLERGSQVHFSFSVWFGTVGNIILGP